MTDQEIIIELAKLDGWREITIKNIGCHTLPVYSAEGVKDKPRFEIVPLYLTSRDAIVPVIEKQTEGIRLLFVTNLFRVFQPTQITGLNSGVAFNMITATPRQLCEALLRATGKWKE